MPRDDELNESSEDLSNEIMQSEEPSEEEIVNGEIREAEEEEVVNGEIREVTDEDVIRELENGAGFADEEKYYAEHPDEKTPAWTPISERRYNADPASFVGKNVAVLDPSLNFDNDREIVGFSLEAQVSFGWRQKPETAGMKRFEDEEAPVEPENGVGPDDERKWLGNLVKDPRKQTVTASMVLTDLDRRTKDIPKEAGWAEDYEKRLYAVRDGMVQHLFGNGNPRGAYECFLDRKLLQNGVAKFDQSKVNAVLSKLTNKEMEKKIASFRSSLPVVNLLADKMREVTRVNTFTLPENYSVSQVYGLTHGMEIHHESDRRALGDALHDMKKTHESRTFWYKIFSFLKYRREGQMIRDGENVLKNSLGFTDAELARPAREPGEIETHLEGKYIPSAEEEFNDLESVSERESVSESSDGFYINPERLNVEEADEEREMSFSSEDQVPDDEPENTVKNDGPENEKK